MMSDAFDVDSRCRWLLLSLVVVVVVVVAKYWNEVLAVMPNTAVIPAVLAKHLMCQQTGGIFAAHVTRMYMPCTSRVVFQKKIITHQVSHCSGYSWLRRASVEAPLEAL
jgi:hypothetical protein